MGIGPTIAAVTAALDLKVVRLLRSAMAAADKGAAGPLGVGSARDNLQPGPRPVLHPQPRILPRPVLHPTPRIEPRRVYHPTKIESRLVVAPAPAECEAPHHTRSPVEPPWKVLPWQQPLPPRPLLKVQIKPPDVLRTGTIYDAFA